METKTSKVTGITYKKEWSGRNGPMHDFYIDFENGDKGVFTCKDKNQNKFQEGKEEKYTIKQDGIYTKIDKPNEGGRGGYQLDPKTEKMKNMMIMRQCALKAANEWAVGKNTGLEESKKLSSKQTTELATVYYDWLMAPFKEELEKI
jgi:hypothetical protein